MARYSPRVLPRGTDYNELANAFMQGWDRSRDRKRQAELDQMARDAHTANLYQQGFKTGRERPTEQVYESDFSGTRFDPERAVMPDRLPNLQAAPAPSIFEPGEEPSFARPRQQLPPGSAPAGNLLARNLHAGLTAPQGGEPRLKALPGAFMPESGTFAPRAIYDQPPAPFEFGAGRMVERPDMAYEQAGDNLWFNEANTADGRRFAREALAADADRLNQEAERNRLADALSGHQNLSPEVIEMLRSGVPLDVATYVPEADRPTNWSTIEGGGGYYQVNPQTGEVRPLLGPGGTQVSRPMRPDGSSEASATSLLNRYAQFTKGVADALERYQKWHMEQWMEAPSPEQLDQFLMRTYGISLKQHYQMQKDMLGLWGDRSNESAEGAGGGSNMFLPPLIPSSHGEALRNALLRARLGGEGASQDPVGEDPRVGEVPDSGQSGTHRLVAPTETSFLPRGRTGRVLGRDRGQQTRPTLEERVAELKASGVDKETARETLIREGYDL